MMLAGLAGIIIIFSTLFTCQGRAAGGKGLNYDGMFPGSWVLRGNTAFPTKSGYFPGSPQGGEPGIKDRELTDSELSKGEEGYWESL